MSFRVLVVPEDPTNNGYILRPLVRKIMSELGKPQARVEILTNPRTEGYESACAYLRNVVLDRYARRELLLFLPDADGKDRSGEFRGLEGSAKNRRVHLLCCAAVQEVEAWILAGHVKKLDRSWPMIRKDCSVKERVFDSFLGKHGDPRAAGGGRERLMEETLENYAGLLERCPELMELQKRIAAVLAEPKR